MRNRLDGFLTEAEVSHEAHSDAKAIHTFLNVREVEAVVREEFPRRSHLGSTPIWPIMLINSENSETSGNSESFSIPPLSS